MDNPSVTQIKSGPTGEESVKKTLEMMISVAGIAFFMAIGASFFGNHSAWPWIAATLASITSSIVGLILLQQLRR